ncbi:hypothetical protein [Nocardia sp. NBC_00511]|uniref:hypothetical protein n=1 Tax=Nocardia sp. NBC_00511 TaxID=2903591 RepID=UPI0030DEFFD1
MTDMLRADLTALRIMAAGVRAQGEAISGIDPVDLIAKAGLAMPDSATGTACAGLGAPLLAALRRMAGGLNAFADAADHGATTYEDTTSALTAQLNRYLPSAS